MSYLVKFDEGLYWVIKAFIC